MLPSADEIHELQVDNLDFILLRKLQHLTYVRPPSSFQLTANETVQPLLGRFRLEKILDGRFDSRSQPFQLPVILQFLSAPIGDIEHVGDLVQPR